MGDLNLARKIARDRKLVMTGTSIVVVLALLGFSTEARGDQPANPVFEELSKGVEIDGTKVTLPSPSLTDNETAESEARVLKSIADLTKLPLADFSRDAITAPFVLKTRDEVAANGTIHRFADLWFVIRADHENVDISKVFADLAKGQEVEAGNMKFRSVGVPADALAKLGIAPAVHGEQEQFVHQTGRLFGRIIVDETDRVTATSTDASTLIAGRTDPRFDDFDPFPNRWSTLEKKGASEVVGKPVPFRGTFSYMKATRLKSISNGLLVEVHFVYAEPKAWFNGGPILKSKFGAVAQDRIRSLRRDLAKIRKEHADRPAVPAREAKVKP